MLASREFASNNQPNSRRDREPILICGVNWIGDSIMTMPALQRFRRQHPDFHIALLVIPPLAPLWRLHGAPDEIITASRGTLGTWRVVGQLRAHGFRRAWVLPNSFRSALLPWLAGIPERTGYPGHTRSFLLTHVVRSPAELEQRHQAWEYMHLLCPDCFPGESLELPALRITEEWRAAAMQLLEGVGSKYVMFLPGAARGPAKQWPAAHFVALGRKLATHSDLHIVVSGARNEYVLCERIATAIGPRARNLAGRTTLAEWAALLAGARLVICNDSGGMHLAAAVGAPLIALYGITDPNKTGPLGIRCRVLQNSPERHRDIPRCSREAAKWLASITPEQVYEEALKILRSP